MSATASMGRSINIKFTTEFKYPAPKKRKMEGGKRK